MPRTITWPELIMLMVFGTGAEDSFVAEVRARDEREADEYGYRVFRRGTLARREGLDGQVHFIDGEDYRWMRYVGDEEFTAFPRERHVFASPIGGLSVGGDRPSLSRWDGNDFTRPTGPAEPVEFLERPAWSVELAPPAHKPHPIQLVVDAETGLVLRQANAGFGTYTELVSLQLDAELPDELFVWDGPTRQPINREAEHERDMANRRAWLASRGITDLPLAFVPELMPHVWDDATGAFEASFSTNAYGSLIRRPRNEEPWPELDGQNWPHTYRWSDERWDWFVGCDRHLDADRLAALKAGLTDST
ncbi:MAG TPA: hypothetical protein VFE40_13630 [Jatrophihabitantaceae bacterium]|jgi:hypothetical protein|nr:hypothetical protein [Jatrophihabitantaceae bacterium]